MRQERCFKAMAGLLLLTFLISCAGTQRKDLSNSFSPDVKIVTVSELTRLETAEKYFDKEVGFMAKFQEIHMQVSWSGMEQYKNTHFSVSLVSRNDLYTLPYVLVPAYEQVLSRLKQGDLVSVEGIVENLSEGFTYIVVTKLKNLSRPSPTTADSARSTMKNP